MTYLQAALTILAYTDRPLSVGELTAVAVGQGLIHPRGRTPDRSMSSILYRRMAADADAPIMAMGGHFWLRGRSLPSESDLALRPAIRRIHRSATGSRRSGAPAHPRRATPLPPAPIRIPLAGGDLTPASLPMDLPGTGRRERAVGRIADGLRSLAGRLGPLWPAADGWDAERARVRLVAPVLTLLGYRRADQQAPQGQARGRSARLLLAGGEPAILLEVVRPGLAIGDAEAHATLARAVAEGVRWALLSNGREMRLYTTAVAGALADPGRALVMRLDPFAWTDESGRLDAARLLWPLSRDAAAAGSLDAYLAARAVGAALLAALDDPRSPLVGALGEAVQAATGLDLPAALLARQARLAVRGPRGRDGEPLPAEVPAVAAVPALLPAAGRERDAATREAS